MQAIPLLHEGVAERGLFLVLRRFKSNSREISINKLKRIVEENKGGKMHITIPITPVSKKNHQQIIMNPKTKRPMVIPSKQYRQYEKDCGAFLNPLPFTCIEEPVNVKCLYYMPTHRRCDLVNLQEATLDVLVKYGIIADDNSNIVASMDGSRVLYDKENPRTEIEIELL